MTEKQLKKKILDSGRTLLFSNEDLKRLIIPLVIDQVLVRTVGMADTMMISSVGEAAISGVSLVDMINMLINAIFAAVATGGAVIASQYLGHRDREKACEASSQLMVVTAVCALVFTVLSLVARKPLLSLLFGRIDADVMDAALTYLTVSAISFPFLASFNSSSALFRAMNDSRTPTMVSLGMNVMNLVGNSILIFGMKWGVAGAAIATIAAQAVSGILCLIYIRFRVPLLTLSRADCKADAESIRDLVVMGIPMGLQTSITAIGSMVMQAANNGLGSVYVSGFTAGMRLKQFCMCPFDALGSAVSVFCGQNLGAKKPERIRQGVRLGVIVGVAYGFCIGLVMIFFGRSMSTLFVESSAGDVLDASAKYLRCMGYFFWSLGILNICRMATQGIGFSGRAVFSGVTEMFARSIVSLGFVGAFGYTAICFSDQTAWIAAVLYITPTCLHCIKKVTKQIEAEKANANLSESVG